MSLHNTTLVEVVLLERIIGPNGSLPQFDLENSVSIFTEVDHK